jgi:DNA-binding transcriptional regulator YdaS (Cro superfamily)
MALQDELDTPLAQACRKLGGQSALARLIGKHQTSIFEWLKDSKPLPAEHVFAVEAATGISRHDLRPDIYPRADPSAQSPAEYPPAPLAAPNTNDALAGVQS